MFRIKMYDSNTKVLRINGNCFKQVLRQFLINITEKYNLTSKEIISIMEKKTDER